MVVCVGLLYDKLMDRCLSSILCIGILVLSMCGLPYKVLASDDTYPVVRKFVRDLPIKEDDVVVAPYTTFYDVREKTRNSYFIQTYPIKYLPKMPDYIIIGDEGYNIEALDAYLQELKGDANNVVKRINYLDKPRLEVWKIVFDE